jgi:hypothetical protein
MATILFFFTIGKKTVLYFITKYLPVQKNFLVVFVLIISVGALSSSFVSFNHPLYSSIPPMGYTGAVPLNGTCNVCHSGNPLNEVGGSVSVVGLPTSSYSAGMQYNFSLTITHGTADRIRWGFSMAARNSAGDPVGTFSTVDPDPLVSHAAVNGNDFSHYVAVITPPQSSYTYVGLRWTAPAVPGPNDGNVTFYYVGNAADGTGNTLNDYIYTSTSASVLPVTLSLFDATVFNKNSALLKWRTETEINTNYFSIEKSDDGVNFTEISRVPAAGNSSAARNYSFEDKGRGLLSTVAKYRVTTVDVDGKKSLSSIKQILFESDVKFIGQPFPSPVRTGAQTQFDIVSDKKQTVILSVFSEQSKLLKTQTIAVNKGRNIFKLDIPNNWPSGLAIASFNMNDKKQQVSFMIVQ